MAASVHSYSEKSASVNDFHTDDIVKCGICDNWLDDPRTLSCLHSFCLKCLKRENKPVQGKPSRSLACLTCGTGTPIPVGGLTKLGVISVISRMRDERLAQEYLADEDADIECTACDGTGMKEKTKLIQDSESGSMSPVKPPAVARCFECNDYLCERCLKVHKFTRSLKLHPVVTIDELRSGDAAPVTTSSDDATCSQHAGKALDQYCTTCDMPICTKCAISGRHKAHKKADLDEIVERRSKHIEKLVMQASDIESKLDGLIEKNTEIERNLQLSKAAVMTEMDKAAEKAEEKFQESLKKARTNAEAKLTALEIENKKLIDDNLKELERARERLFISKQVAELVIQQGSNVEVAAVHASLTKSLNEMLSKQPTSLFKNLGKIRFTASDFSSVEVKTIGTLAIK